MHFETMCLHCKKRLKVSRENQGKAALCPFCGRRMTLEPAPTPDSADPPTVIPEEEESTPLVSSKEYRDNPPIDIPQIPDEPQRRPIVAPLEAQAKSVVPDLALIADFSQPAPSKPAPSKPVPGKPLPAEPAWRPAAGCQTVSAAPAVATTKGPVPRIAESNTWNRLLVAVTAATFLGLLHVCVRTATDPGDRFYAFLYQRGFVQHATLYVACLVAVLLIARRFRYLRDRRCFEAVEQGRGAPPEVLDRHLTTVSTMCDEHGAAAAVACAQRLAEENGTRVRKAYEAIHFLAGSLPALGLFGTMLGLSSALYAAFSAGTLNADSIQRFVTGLATAMDTTVLAMACAIPLFACAWLQSRAEQTLAEGYAAHICKQFELQDLPATDQTVDVLHEELRRLMRKIGWEARSNFEQLLETSTKQYQQQLERAVQEIFATQREHDERMVQTVSRQVTDSLSQSVDRVGDLFTEQNGRMTDGMIRQVAGLTETIQRSPSSQ